MDISDENILDFIDSKTEFKKEDVCKIVKSKSFYSIDYFITLSNNQIYIPEKDIISFLKIKKRKELLNNVKKWN